MKNGTVLEKNVKNITKASIPDLLFNTLFLQKHFSIGIYSIEKQTKRHVIRFLPGEWGKGGGWMMMIKRDK